MQAGQALSFISDRKRIVLDAGTILYVCVIDRRCELHLADGAVHETRMSLGELEQALGGEFIRIDRSCIVSAMAIHDITNRVNLVNGEALEYALRRKKRIVEQLQSAQQRVIQGFAQDGVPVTDEDYHRHYASFDTMPFAFADIEMVFDTEQRAVDWIFRYGNPALARLEKIPLERLIGSRFGSLFSNMSAKWLSLYERATLYGEILEVVDFSPEVNATLKVICFPTFRGHCGCILFDLSGIRYVHGESADALARYLGCETVWHEAMPQ